MTDHGVNKFDEVVGLLKRASLIKYLPNEGKMLVRLATGQQAIKGQDPVVPIKIQVPHSMFYNNGLFIGTLPAEGTPVIIGQGSGGQYHFVSFVAEDLSKVPTIKSGELLIHSGNNSKITLDTKSNITIGSDQYKIHINAASNLITTNFHNENHFTQASRKVDGVIKRDLKRNTKISENSKLEGDEYDSYFQVIGMDPKSTTNGFITGSSKNPPFVESRELVYEFQYNSDVDNDLKESSRYGTEKPTVPDYSFPNRRKSRADTLSLSLVAPNYLMETIKGTIVDIFGNILDLNRVPLPVGQGQNTINKTQSDDKLKSFLLIKELERKSLAFHFEINARKDLTGKTKASAQALPDVNSSDDYARSRSRFFMDIDKEGQFKLNIPASSETGNIPLLTRYENYSTFGADDNGNPNKLVFKGAGNDFDIYQDSFASPLLTPTDAGFLMPSDGTRGSIKLKGGDGTDGAPQDRLTGTHIKHGMAYHDVMQTCFVHQDNKFLDYQTGEQDPLTIRLDLITPLTNIVNDTIIISGDNANAGGRSGSISADGSLEINIGANTIDRQSLWFDTAGGAVINIGRDINGRSVMASTGGDFYLQVGGFGVTGDTRFATQNNGIVGSVLDLRILTSGGYCHMIRCDENGISIMTPGNLAIHASGDLALTSDKNIRIECNTLIMQERMHLKTLGGSS